MAEPEEWPAEATSVMLRNIPNRYTPEELLHDMLERGFEGAFDFFYLPTDFTTKKNKGYGFVNLRSPKLAREFREAFHSLQFTRYVTQKVLEMTPATTQGFEGNVVKYLKHQAGRVQNPWFKPMIFVKGEGADTCLPLAEENLPESVRSTLKTSRQVQAQVPAERLALALNSGDEGEEGEACSPDSGVADTDAVVLSDMQSAVRRFLRSCSEEQGQQAESVSTRKCRGGRRRGGKAARQRTQTQTS